MKNVATPVLAVLLALLGTGCHPSGTSNNDQHLDNDKPYQCLGASLKATDKNNYSTWSKMTLPVIKAKPDTELSFEWGSVTKDFITHALDPKADLDMMMVLFFQLPLADLETKLNADTLTQNDLVVAPPLTSRKKGATSAKLFDFDLNGVAVTPDQIMKYFDADFYPPANYTYALAGAHGDEVGQGIRVVQAFQLDPGTSNTDVKLTDNSVKLEWKANLHDLIPTGVPKGQAAITLDWGDMTKTGLGTDFDPTQITRALVARYDQSSGALEKDFLNIELIATQLYQGDVDVGTSKSLSSLKNGNGETFPGIDDTGTWLVALQCGVCRNPSPWYLSILKPCQ